MYSAVFLFVFFVFQLLMGYTLQKRYEKLVENVYFPIKRWQDFYNKQKKSIDLIFLGSSHCYRSLVPAVFDSTLNVNSYNLGSSSKSVSTSYYVLKEALQTQTPNTVILEIHHGPLLSSNNYRSILHNYPFMKSFSKFELLKTLQPKQGLTMALFPLERIAQEKRILFKNEKVKINRDYNRISVYDHKGFVFTYTKADYSYNFNDSILPNHVPKINQERFNHLIKIKKLCNKNNIKLILVTQPIHPDYYNTEPIQKLYKKITYKINSEEIPYFNFNEIAPLPSKFYYDSGHIVYDGSIIFSKNVAQTIKNKHLKE